MSDQPLGEVSVDSPISSSVGIGERAVRDGGPKSQVIELAATGAKPEFRISETLPRSDLGKCYGEKRIPAGERTGLVAVLVALDATAKPPGVD